MAQKMEQRRWSPWTPADDLKVIENRKLPSSVIADLLGRTTNAVEFRRAHIASKLTMLRDEALPDAWCCRFMAANLQKCQAIQQEEKEFRKLHQVTAAFVRKECCPHPDEDDGEAEQPRNKAWPRDIAEQPRNKAWLRDNAERLQDNAEADRQISMILQAAQVANGEGGPGPAPPASEEPHDVPPASEGEEGSVGSIPNCQIHALPQHEQIRMVLQALEQEGFNLESLFNDSDLAPYVIQHSWGFAQYAEYMQKVTGVKKGKKRRARA